MTSSRRSGRRSSLYGEAALNKSRFSQASFVQFPMFWRPFRHYFPLIAPLVLGFTFAVPFMMEGSQPPASSFFLAGSILSVVSTVMTIVSYFHILPWRRHPSFLLLQRVLSSLLFSIAIVVKGLTEGDNTVACLPAKSFLLQFSLFSGELWFFTLSLDLYQSLTNPFSSYSRNQRIYSIFVWMTSIAIGIFLVTGVGQCQGRLQTKSGISVCWIADDMDSRASACFWTYFLAPVGIVYMSSIMAVYFASSRLARGLESTYSARAGCVVDSFRMVFCHIVYGILVAVLYVTISRDPATGLLSPTACLFSYAVGCRGYFDSIVWFFLHDFERRRSKSRGAKAGVASWGRRCLLWLLCGGGGGAGEPSDRTTPLLSSSGPLQHQQQQGAALQSDTRASRVSFAAALLESADGYYSASSDDEEEEDGDGDQHGRGGSAQGEFGYGYEYSYNRGMEVGDGSMGSGSLSASASGSGSGRRGQGQDGGGGVFDGDVDLTPQLNLALRQEVLHYVTTGIRESVVRWIARQAGDISRGRQLSAESGLAASATTATAAAAAVAAGAGDSSSSTWPRDRTISASGASYPSVSQSQALYQSHHQSQSLGAASLSASYVSQHGGLSLVGQSLRQALTSAANILGVPRGPGEWGEDPIRLEQQQRGGAGAKARQDSAASSPSWRHTENAFTSPLRGVGQGQWQGQGQGQGQGGIQSSPGAISGTSAAAALPLPPPQEVVFDLDDKHRFRDWRPATFATLRAMSGISCERYLELMAQPAREQLSSEGGSGAFQFSCGHGEILVKTVSAGERSTLLRILDGYLQHLERHPDSLLVRFLGLHSLTLFGRQFSFVVMKNAFPPTASINERYDLKGSWVGRNAKALVPGSRQNCRHCAETFVVGGSAANTCPVAVAGHEPNVVLKDNDLIHKLRLRRDDCYEVIEALNRDSDALCALGITDYSLLVGVKNRKYDLEAIFSSSTPSATPRAMTQGVLEMGGTGAPLTRSFASCSDMAEGERSGPAGALGEDGAPGEGAASSAAADSEALAVGRNERDSIASTAETVLCMQVSSLAPHQRHQIISARGREGGGGGGGGGGVQGEAGERESMLRSASGEYDASGLRGLVSRDSDFEGLGPFRADDESGPALPLMSQHARALRAEGYPARAVIAPSHYFLGIVDILQDWSLAKKAEYLFRVYVLGQPAAGISCAAPDSYKTRWQGKVSQVFDHALFVREVTGSWSASRVVSQKTVLEEADVCGSRPQTGPGR